MRDRYPNTKIHFKPPKSWTENKGWNNRIIPDQQQKLELTTSDEVVVLSVTCGTTLKQSVRNKICREKHFETSFRFRDIIQDEVVEAYFSKRVGVIELGQ